MCLDVKVESRSKNACQFILRFARKMLSYQRPTTLCCILEGDIDNGGLGTLIPVFGLTIGIFLVRPAGALCIFICEGWKKADGDGAYGFE